MNGVISCLDMKDYREESYLFVNGAGPIRCQLVVCHVLRTAGSGLIVVIEKIIFLLLSRLIVFQTDSMNQWVGQHLPSYSCVQFLKHEGSDKGRHWWRLSSLVRYWSNHLFWIFGVWRCVQLFASSPPIIRRTRSPGSKLRLEDMTGLWHDDLPCCTM